MRIGTQKRKVNKIIDNVTVILAGLAGIGGIIFKEEFYLLIGIFMAIISLSNRPVLQINLDEEDLKKIIQENKE